MRRISQAVTSFEEVEGRSMLRIVSSSSALDDEYGVTFGDAVGAV